MKCLSQSHDFDLLQSFFTGQALTRSSWWDGTAHPLFQKVWYDWPSLLRCPYLLQTQFHVDRCCHKDLPLTCWNKKIHGPYLLAFWLRRPFAMEIWRAWESNPIRKIHCDGWNFHVRKNFCKGGTQLRRVRLRLLCQPVSKLITTMELNMWFAGMSTNATFRVQAASIVKAIQANVNPLPRKPVAFFHCVPQAQSCVMANWLCFLLIKDLIRWTQPELSSDRVASNHQGSLRRGIGPRGTSRTLEKLSHGVPRCSPKISPARIQLTILPLLKALVKS